MEPYRSPRSPRSPLSPLSPLSPRHHGEKTVAELRRMASDLQIVGRSKLRTKAELERAVSRSQQRSVSPRRVETNRRKRVSDRDVQPTLPPKPNLKITFNGTPQLVMDESNGQLASIYLINLISMLQTTKPTVESYPDQGITRYNYKGNVNGNPTQISIQLQTKNPVSISIYQTIDEQKGEYNVIINLDANNGLTFYGSSKDAGNYSGSSNSPYNVWNLSLPYYTNDQINQAYQTGKGGGSCGGYPQTQYLYKSCANGYTDYQNAPKYKTTNVEQYNGSSCQSDADCNCPSRNCSMSNGTWGYCQDMYGIRRDCLL